MSTHPNDGSNDNPDEFSEFRKPRDTNNLKEGKEAAQEAPHSNPNDSKPAPGTPHYGAFGTQETPSDTEHKPAGTNPGGAAAPDTVDPLQRGGVAQNQDTQEVVNSLDAPEDERRASYADDDPRYGSGTRNWPTNEPANRTTEGSDPNEDNL